MALIKWEIGKRTIEIKLWHFVFLWELILIFSAPKMTLYSSYFGVTLFISCKTFFSDNYVRNGRYPILSRSGVKNLFWCFGVNSLFFGLGFPILIELNSWPKPLVSLQILWGCYWFLSFVLCFVSGMALLIGQKD